jgi:pyruvate formate lyase activating enzyme
MREMGIWVEVTTLVVPGTNDSEEELKKIADFLVSIGKDLPWHVSAYYPQYKSKIPGTDFSSIKNAVEIGKQAGLRYVYGGNVPGSNYENTYCSNCGDLVLKRAGFSVLDKKIKDDCCLKCGSKIEGVF